jgi:hypothetical protein
MKAFYLALLAAVLATAPVVAHAGSMPDVFYSNDDGDDDHDNGNGNDDQDDNGNSGSNGGGGQTNPDQGDDEPTASGPGLWCADGWVEENDLCVPASLAE